MFFLSVLTRTKWTKKDLEIEQYGLQRTKKTSFIFSFFQGLIERRLTNQICAKRKLWKYFSCQGEIKEAGEMKLKGEIVNRGKKSKNGEELTEIMVND